jgi:hypothetical protein
MAYFDDEQQKKHLQALRNEEEEELVETLARTKYKMPYINLKGVAVENEALRVIPENIARTLQMGPFNIKGRRIMIAVRSPQKDGVENQVELLRQKGLEIELYMASTKSLEKVWERYAEVPPERSISPKKP